MSIKSQITTAHNELKAHIDARLDRLEAMLQPEQPQPPVWTDDTGPAPITMLGLPTQQEKALLAAGFTTFNDLHAASDEELMDVTSVGKRTVEFIRGEIA